MIECTAAVAWDQRDSLTRRFLAVRQRTESLAEPLSAEDMGGQSMADASPTKWHLAHTSWFFSTFLPLGLVPPPWAALYNSYYQSIGRPYSRPQRGLLTRPSLAEVMDWRSRVTAAVPALTENSDEAGWARLAPLLSLGIAHEEQHQELILTDILHLFSCNPLDPAYRPLRPAPQRPTAPLLWLDHGGGPGEIGHAGPGFAFDNEMPRHVVQTAPWRLASRLVTNGEYLEFIDSGGYRRAEFWLADGWATVEAESWTAPLYWHWNDGSLCSMTLAGLQPIDPAAPVAHVSYYEADAFARWAGRRLPTEAEWEIAAAAVPKTGNDLSSGLLRPMPAEPCSGAPGQLFGDLWEWTGSAYAPYPGYRPAAGALGEYNGKFMINQMVLRGGSCVTPPDHLRASYRNFFPPAARWQFTGIRLADDP